MIGLIATLHVNDGSQDAFEEAFKGMIDAVKAAEPGNKLYQLFKSDDPTAYVVMEIYEDEAALAAHGQSDEFKAAGAKLGGLMAGRPDIQRLTSV